jgi:hypothetical protein
MDTRRRRRQRGVTMVEFALVGPLLFVFLFGLVDFSRIIQSKTTVAEAARQAARQGAVNADSTPFPFASSPHAGSCSGTDLTVNANGDGCLTDARMVQTANRFMAQGGLTTNLSYHANTDATACRALAAPAAGSGIICISPTEGLPDPGGVAPANCSSGTPPVATERNRASEWSDHLMKSCYVVQVTVIYTYSPLTGLLQGLIGNRFVLTSTTSTIAEY